jgi:hypothetical protein
MRNFELRKHDAEKRMSRLGGLLRPSMPTMALVVIVTLFLLLPVIYGIAVNLQWIWEQIPLTDYGAGLAMLLLFVLAVLVLVLRRIPLHAEFTALLGLTVASLLIKGLHLYVFEAAVWTDFARMWAAAQQFVKPNAEPFTWITAERTLAFLTPLVYLFGASNLVFKLGNLAAFVAAGLLFYLFARRVLGIRHALVGYAAYSLATESVLAVAIPTHEIPGALYAALCTVLFYFLIQTVRGPRLRLVLGSVLALSFGGALFLLDLQRTLGPPFLFAAILVVSALAFAQVSRWVSARTQWRRLGRPAVLLVLAVAVPIAVLSASWNALFASGLSAFYGPQRSNLFYSYLFYDAHAFSRSSNWTNFAGHHLWKLPAGNSSTEYYDRIRQMGIDVVAADLTHNLAYRPDSFLVKSAHLYVFGRVRFYSVPDKVQRLLTPQGASSYSVQTFRASIVFQNALFLFTAIGLAAKLLVGSVRPLQLFPLIALAAYGSGMIFLGETQPSYAYPAAVTLCFYLGFALSGYRTLLAAAWNLVRRPGRTLRISVMPRLAAFVLPLLGMTLALATTSLIARATYWSAHSRYVLTPDWSVQVDDGRPTAAPQGYLGTFGTLLYPVEGTKASEPATRRVRIALHDLADGDYRAEFFVRAGRAYFERTRYTGPECCLSLRVIAPGAEHAVKLTGKNFVEHIEFGPIKVNGATFVDIEFSLEGDLRNAFAAAGKLPLPIEAEYFRVWRQPGVRQ